MKYFGNCSFSYLINLPFDIYENFSVLKFLLIKFVNLFLKLTGC